MVINGIKGVNSDQRLCIIDSENNLSMEETMKNNWNQSTVIVDDGIELSYTRTGTGEKRPLVLAHGLTDKGLCWHPLASDLEADYDLIMYDAYGHGQSSRVDPQKRFDLAEDLHDLIIALQLEKPGVIGHSMGAATAAEFAKRYPDQLSALVLEDPPWMDPESEVQPQRESLQDWKKQNLEAKKKSIKDLVKLKKKESPNWDEAILLEWAQSKHDMDPTFFDHLVIKHTDWRNVAKAITVPTLIITGDHERGAIITPKLGIEAIRLLEKGEFGHISKAGHCVRYEQYQPYLTMLRLFLKRNI
jgi:pimeloyl-ACP methyl ester carboxylesterase